MKKIAALSFLIGALLAPMTPAQSPLRKSPELAFTLPGQGQRLLSQYRGKVVALEFILTTCPHCQAQSKVMNNMQERYGSQGLQVLDVAIDANAGALVENFS